MHYAGIEVHRPSSRDWHEVRSTRGSRGSRPNQLPRTTLEPSIVNEVEFSFDRSNLSPSGGRGSLADHNEYWYYEKNA